MVEQDGTTRRSSQEKETSAEDRGGEVERYSASEQGQPFGSMRARKEAIAMTGRGDYASDIYRKTGWYFDEKHNEWRGTNKCY